MLALRLGEAGRPELAAEARSGRARAELLQTLLESSDPDPTVVAIVVGRPGAE